MINIESCMNYSLICTFIKLVKKTLLCKQVFRKHKHISGTSIINDCIIMATSLRIFFSIDNLTRTDCQPGTLFTDVFIVAVIWSICNINISIWINSLDNKGSHVIKHSILHT